MARKTVLETINDNSLVLYYLLNKKKGEKHHLP